MIRRLACLAAVLAGASVASAQLPPSISKPIEQARKNVNATNAQTAAVNQPAQPAPAAAQQSKPTAQQQGAPPPANPPAKPPAKSAAKSAAKSQAAAKAPPPAADSSKMTFLREVFTYVPSEIDPFVSPIESGAIRPLIADLKVVGIIFDPTGRNSVVVMRDVSTLQQYRAKTGQLIGRARVSQIKAHEIVLTIEEYGFSREEVLRLNVQQTQQTKGKP